ncbi:uncharacterized protein DFL_000972 [Arthrobotrys flagrans]|uniref:Opioid growth factor receptor (OGFr) conserved domain-containing protein n=1 Tax=Arthrobotrys flagrans TaxID=97331 RepID=A0A437AFT9_ARTFL|nr:hypothetical protein DFL_000972 [Arthrobotrys flagrans]
MDLTEPSLELVDNERNNIDEQTDHQNAATGNTDRSGHGAIGGDADQAMDPARTNLQTKKDLSPVLRFYEGDNIQGRTLEEILEWSDSKLEYTHDFIQILFPIPERSNFTLHPAATLDERTMEAFRNKPELQASMRRALARMLRFFGFDYQIVNLDPDADGAATIQRLVHIVPNAETFPRAARNWMNSHNDLRITRIIRCLRCCGMETEAREFYRALKHLHTSRTGHPRRISDRTFMYWTRAAKRDLRIPPDMSDAEAERFGAT